MSASRKATTGQDHCSLLDYFHLKEIKEQLFHAHKRSILLSEVNLRQISTSK